jgi:uncharacterized protein (DUF1778 family)
MKQQTTMADVNIHLRARPQDRDLIDQAAELTGANRSQFMLASSLREARSVLLDQTTIGADRETFQKVLDWLDHETSPAEAEGMRRLSEIKPRWARD